MRTVPHFVVVCAALGLASVVSACAGPDAAAGAAPRAEYDEATGRLRRVTFDADRNGRRDAVGVMDGARVDHIQLDTDENGSTDYWEYYADRRLVKVGLSRQNDGIIDAFQFYEKTGGAQDGGAKDVITRIEVSTRRDGHFDRIEFYTDGILSRVEEDADGDGRVDKWEHYRPVANHVAGDPPSSVMSVAFDDAHRGRPTRRLVFAGDGSVERVEADPDGDGTFVLE